MKLFILIDNPQIQRQTGNIDNKMLYKCVKDQIALYQQTDYT